MILKLAAIAAVALTATSTMAQPAVMVPLANDYRVAANWLCLPGRADACRSDQTATAVAAGGTTSVAPWRAAKAPKIDCFYVYPTVSLDRSANSDMVPGPEETGVVDQQLNRLASQCRLFAPMYRQVTITALRSVMTGAPMAGVDRELAYHDVRDAWTAYLRDHNRGRGVVLIGHSQGSGVLKRLLAEEIDDKPVQRQLVLAILAGTNVLVPAGQVTGGDFKAIPLCTATGQRGCVVSWVSFRADAPPPANSRFGRTSAAGMKVACVNPAALGGGSGQAEAFFPAGRSGLTEQALPEWAKGTAIATRFVTLPGLITAECVDRDGAQYLALTTHPDTGGTRTATIPGDVVVGGRILADWGLHLIDINAVMGNLVADVAAAGR